MKASIIITGSGISSKYRLLRSIPACKDQVVNLPFNNFKIEFKSKKQAVKALSEAYQLLASDSETKIATSYTRGYILSYDAGTAKIITP